MNEPRTEPAILDPALLNPPPPPLPVVPPPGAEAGPEDTRERTKDPSALTQNVEAPAAKDPLQKRRNETPVLVLGPEAEDQARRRWQGVPPPPPPPASPPPPSPPRTEAMVSDLERKLRETEDRLKEKEAQLANIQSGGAARGKEEKGPAPKVGPAKGAARKSGSGLEALDFFTQAIRAPEPGLAGPPSPEVSPGGGEDPLRSRKGGRDSRTSPAAPAAPLTASLTSSLASPAPGAAPWICPACSARLEKAQCLNVEAGLCLSCKGVFVDARAVRQLGRTQSWFKSVEGFLSAALKKKGSKAR